MVAEAHTVALLLTADGIVRRGLERLARDAGLQLVGSADADSRVAVDAAAVIVVDLDQPGGVDQVAAWRARRPQAFIAGHLGLPRPELWRAAEEAGCDLVANRGALATQLGKRLAAGGRRRSARVRVLDAVDVAGRLGLLRRVDETPLGPMALYQVGGRLCASADVCPHAGARLSEGELTAGVVTCPRHGSRFDVVTGERLRGPADDDLRTCPVVVENDAVYLET